MSNSFGTYYLMTGLLAALLIMWSCSDSKTQRSQAPAEQTQPMEEVEGGDTLQVTGRLICAHCYALNDENIGHDHELPQSGFRENCASFCAMQSYPVGVLLDEPIAGSRVWVIRTASQLFADYMTQTVRIEGIFASQGVIEPLSIELQSAKDKWITIM